jgi:hypothetical protein
MRRTGSLWQPGYYEHRSRDEADLRKQARYLLENPLRKNLAARIDDHPAWWCRWIAGSQDLS